MVLILYETIGFDQRSKSILHCVRGAVNQTAAGKQADPWYGIFSLGNSANTRPPLRCTTWLKAWPKYAAVD
jgi:hypothetical protein